MSLEEKIRYLEELLMSTFVEEEVDVFTGGELIDGYTTFRARTIGSILDKLNILPFPSDFASLASDDSYDGCFSLIMNVLLDNLSTWSFFVLGRDFLEKVSQYLEREFSEIEAQELLNLSSPLMNIDVYEERILVNQEKLRNFVVSKIRNEVENFPDTQPFIKLLSACIAHCDDDEEYWECGLIFSSALQKLIEDGNINEAVLDAFNWPLLHYPYDYEPTWDSEKCIGAFLLGYSNMLSTNVLNFDCVSWRFILAMVYVHLSYQMHYGCDEREFVIGDYVFV